MCIRDSTIVANGRTKAHNPAMLVQIEDVVTANDPNIAVVSVVRNKDESDAQERAKLSQDLVEKYRQRAEAGLTAVETNQNRRVQGHVKAPSEKVPAETVEDPAPSSNTVNVSIATVVSTRGSGTIKKNRHPVMVKDETAMTRPMEDFRNSRVLKVTHGAEPRLNDLTLTSAQRMEWTRPNLAGTHPRPGPMPAKILRKFKQQAVITALSLIHI